MRRFLRHRTMTLATLALGAAIAFPLGALASHQFADVPDSNQYHDHIEALANAGVTIGCGGGNYCPSDFVSREQMAAFLNRLGALSDDQPPVVNADEVDGVDEVLGAGDIEVTDVGHWVPLAGSPVSVSFGGNSAFLSSGGAFVATVYLHLEAPAAIDDRTYGFTSAEICTFDSDGTIINTFVREARSTGTVTHVTHATDHPLAADQCYLVTDPSPTIVDGAVYLDLQVSFAGAGIADLGIVRTTWSPTIVP